MKTPLLSSLAILVAILAAGCWSQARPVQELPATAVRTATVTQAVRALPIRTSGRLAPKAQMHLSFKTGGLIERFLVDEGAAVRAGQLLARLDLAEVDAQVQQARSAFDKARRAADRMTALYRDSVATLEQMQNTETAAEVAASGLRIARFNLRHSEIRAPADGRVLRRMAERSELVGAGQPVLVLGALGWVVRAGLADRDVVRLRQGDEARLRFDAYPDSIFAGWVSEIAEAADPMTGTFEVEITVADPHALLKTGFIARVDVLPSDGEPLFFIPAEALVEGEGRDGIVYAVGPDGPLVRRTPIRIAHILDGEIAVAAGLESVTAVITDGAAYLTDGARVTVVE